MTNSIFEELIEILQVCSFCKDFNDPSHALFVMKISNSFETQMIELH
jgi:hypothetical protein